MKNISFFISNVMIMTFTRNSHRQTSHAKIFFRNCFQNRKKNEKKRTNRINYQTMMIEKTKFRKRFFHKKIAFHQTNISKIEMNIDKINTIKIVTNIRTNMTKIATMKKNATRINIRIKTGIAIKLAITSDLMLDFRMLNFKKRTRIIMNMKIFMQITNYTKK